MKKSSFIFIISAITLLIFTACNDNLIVEAGEIPDPNNGNTGGAVYVPGGEGRTSDDLVFDEDFRVFSMDTGIDPEVVTTQETLGRWDDGKYHIQGLSYLSTSSLSASGFVDGYFVYWNKPLEGDYKLSARIRMTAVQGFSTSKGVQFGVFAPMNQSAANGDQVFGSNSRAAGILFRSSIGSSNPVGEIRYYYATDSSNVNYTAGTSSHPGNHIIHDISYKNEYILELSRNEAGYTMRVLNSKTGELIPKGSMLSYNNPTTVSETASGTGAIHPNLKYGKPVYAGFALMGCSAELSQIRIWDNSDGTGDPVFSTPDTIPGYVPVEILSLNFNPPAPVPGGSNPPKYTYALSTIESSGIALQPSVSPAWADNSRVQWFMESCSPDGALSINGTGTPFTVANVNGTTYEFGKITANAGLIASGTGASAIFIAVARDLSLDNFSGDPPVDYPLKQTLAEYRFEIAVTNN